MQHALTSLLPWSVTTSLLLDAAPAVPLGLRVGKMGVHTCTPTPMHAPCCRLPSFCKLQDPKTLASNTLERQGVCKVEAGRGITERQGMCKVGAGRGITERQGVCKVGAGRGITERQGVCKLGAGRGITERQGVCKLGAGRGMTERQGACKVGAGRGMTERQGVCKVGAGRGMTGHETKATGRAMTNWDGEGHLLWSPIMATYYVRPRVCLMCARASLHIHACHWSVVHPPASGKVGRCSRKGAPGACSAV